jgi:hypothetical protein
VREKWRRSLTYIYIESESGLNEGLGLVFRVGLREGLLYASVISGS